MFWPRARWPRRVHPTRGKRANKALESALMSKGRDLKLKTLQLIYRLTASDASFAGKAKDRS